MINQLFSLVLSVCLFLFPLQSSGVVLVGFGTGGGGGPPGGCTPSGGPFTDVFTHAVNGDALPVYSTDWTEIATADNNLHIFTNAVDFDRSAGTQYSHFYKYAPTGTVCEDNFINIQFTNTITSGHGIRLYSRLQNDNSAYFVEFLFDNIPATGDYNLWQWRHRSSGGTLTTIDSTCDEGTFTGTLSLNDRVQIRVEGTGSSTVVTLIEYDGTNPGTDPGSFPAAPTNQICTFTADPASPIDVEGAAGIQFRASATNARLDNLAWGDM